VIEIVRQIYSIKLLSAGIGTCGQAQNGDAGLGRSEYLHCHAHPPADSRPAVVEPVSNASDSTRSRAWNAGQPDRLAAIIQANAFCDGQPDGAKRRIDASGIRMPIMLVEKSKESEMSYTMNSKTMIIVEDDDALRGRLEIAMQKRGFQVRTAPGVAEGLEAIDQEIPNFAIIDLRLRDGSGLDVVKSLEERDPDARAIILTGYGDIPTAVAAARVGAVDYIAKPATADEIVDVLLAPKDQNPPAPVNTISPDDARLEHIAHFFHEAGDNFSVTARLLNMHRRSLQRILKRNGVSANATR